MKNIKRISITAAFLVFTAFAFAQTPPPPNNGTTGSGGSTPVGGGAPVGSGLLIMIAAAGAYAGKQYFKK